MGSRQDVTDAAEAKSKILNYRAIIKELVDVGLRVHRNLKRLNEQGNVLAVHSSKIQKLETTVENIEKGNVLLEKESVLSDLEYDFTILLHTFKLFTHKLKYVYNLPAIWVYFFCHFL